MEIDRRELKRQAREAIRVSRPSFWVVTLVYLLMTTGVSTLAGLLVPAPDTGNISLPALFLSILLSLYSTVVGFGFTLWSMWTSRKLSPGLGSLADGFSVALLVIMTSILIFLHMLAWSLLCIPVVWLVLIPVLLSPSLSFLVIPVLIAGIMIFSYWVSLRYALAYYLLADHPDHGAFAAVRRSVELTRGWKWEMFKLFFLLSRLGTAGSTSVHAGPGPSAGPRRFFPGSFPGALRSGLCALSDYPLLSQLRPSSPAGLHPGKAVALSLPLRDHGRLLRRPAAPPAGGFCGDAPSLNIQSYPPGPLGPGVFLEASLFLEHSFDIRTNV